MLGFVDNFEQHFEICVLNTQNPLKRGLNKVNGLNTSKSEVIKIFRGFRVFEFALRRKVKTRKCPKSTESFLNKKSPIVNDKNYSKTDKRLPVCYLSNSLALIIRKATFKQQ